MYSGGGEGEERTCGVATVVMKNYSAKQSELAEKWRGSGGGKGR
jgi:hypothetical protein